MPNLPECKDPVVWQTRRQVGLRYLSIIRNAKAVLTPDGSASHIAAGRGTRDQSGMIRSTNSVELLHKGP
jgi:hypothetical protein